MKRMTCAEITAAIHVGLPFTATWHQKILTAAHIDVLTSTLGAIPGTRLSVPLAVRVRESEREYSIQYLTRGGRKRLQDEVAYYIAQYDPETENHYVLAILTADGSSEHAADAQPHPAALVLPDATIAGLPGAAEIIARQLLQSDELHTAQVRSDAAWTFQLFTRSTKSAIQTAQPVAVFSTREEAYAAMRDADRTHDERQAWIERYESGGPLYGVALGHGTYDCLGPDLVTGITSNVLEARRCMAMIRLAQPGADIALAVKRAGDDCYRVEDMPVAQWIRHIADPAHD